MRLPAFLIGLMTAICVSAASAFAEELPPASRKIVPPDDAWMEKVEKASPEKPTVAVTSPRKVLVFALHTAFDHKVIPHLNAALKILGDKSGAFEATISFDIEDLSAESLAKYDVLVLNNNCSAGPRRNLLLDELERNERYQNMDKMQRQAQAAELEKSMLDFVASGKGLTVFHGAPVLLNNSEEFTEMVGCAFHYHPPTQRVTLNVVEADHPLLAAFRGKGPLVHTDEPYCFNGAYEKKDVRPLLAMDTTKLKGFKGTPGETRYVCWIRPHGKGRVFYCSPSHYPETYESPTMLRFILDAMQYAAGDLKCEDAKP